MKINLWLHVASSVLLTSANAWRKPGHGDSRALFSDRILVLVLVGEWEEPATVAVSPAPVEVGDEGGKGLT